MRWCKALSTWLLVTAIILPTSIWLAKTSAFHALGPQLLEQLVPRMQLVTVNSYGAETILSHLVSEVNTDLKQIETRGLWPLLAACQASVQFLEYQHEPPAAHQLEIPWQAGGQQQQMQLNLACQTDWLRASAVASLLALFPALMVLALPRTLTSGDLRALQRLRDIGVRDEVSTEQLLGMRQMDSDGLELLERLISIHGFSLAAALHQLDQQIQLSFSANLQQVRLFGISLNLSRTPRLYLYWYAVHRVTDDELQGWIVNPASNRPDSDMANELLALLDSHRGDARAIRELRENGLRARTLDQNRSKIRDEVSSVLGNKLTERFLFEMARDPRTARYAFRLALKPDEIEI